MFGRPPGCTLDVMAETASHSQTDAPTGRPRGGEARAGGRAPAVRRAAGVRPSPSGRGSGGIRSFGLRTRLALAASLLALRGTVAAGAPVSPGGPAVPAAEAAFPPADTVPDGELPTYRGAEGRVYLTRDEALRQIFPRARRVRAERWRLDRSQAKTIESEARTEVPGSRPVVYRALGEGGRLLGYAMIVEEKGKYRPITAMVGVGPDLSVRRVEIMVYREDRGEEVRYRRFLRQYRGKTAADPVRTHRDIMNVTGATISVHSVNAGVRRALATLTLLYAGERSSGDPTGGEPAPEQEPTPVAEWRLDGGDQG